MGEIEADFRRIEAIMRRMWPRLASENGNDAGLIMACRFDNMISSVMQSTEQAPVASAAATLHKTCDQAQNDLDHCSPNMCEVCGNCRRHCWSFVDCQGYWTRHDEQLALKHFGATEE